MPQVLNVSLTKDLRWKRRPHRTSLFRPWLKRPS